MVHDLTDGAERSLEELARRIVELRLQTPVTFLLEMHRPLAGVLHTMTLFSAPFARPLFGAQLVHSFQLLFEDSRHLEFFLLALERYSAHGLDNPITRGNSLAETPENLKDTTDSSHH